MNIFITFQKPCAFEMLSNKRKRREPKPSRKHSLGQQIRWVRQYNEAMARAFRHWKSTGHKGSPLTNIVHIRAFKRHFRKACRIEALRELPLVSSDDLPPANIPHSEPDYDSNKVRK